MSLWIILCAAALLSLERLCYVWIWHAPDAFRTLCARPGIASRGEAVDIVQKLFYGFKGLQCAVFLGWCYVYGHGSLWPLHGHVWSLGLGGACIVAGQILNVSVFYRLGRIGVFYGNKFGYEIPWCRAFPFSWLQHPQYVGTLLSIWGFFLLMRFPHADWYLLPILETVYYVGGAFFEQQGGQVGEGNARICMTGAQRISSESLRQTIPHASKEHDAWKRRLPKSPTPLRRAIALWGRSGSPTSPRPPATHRRG
jgi:hypothetical protein